MRISKGTTYFLLSRGQLTTNMSKLLFEVVGGSGKVSELPQLALQVTVNLLLVKLNLMKAVLEL